MRRLAVHATLLVLSVGTLTACSPGEETPTSGATPTPTASETTSASSTTTEPPSTEPSGTASPTATATATGSESITEPPADELSIPDDAGGFGTDVQTVDGWPVMEAQGTYLTQVRAAAHDGFDRVVLEFEAAAPPSYHVSYVDGAFAEGSGAPIDIDGTAFLRVDTAIVVQPFDLGDPDDSVLTGPSDIGDAAIGGLFSEGPWEGHAATHIGLDGVRDFRVTTLSSPARIVVDIKR